MKLTFLFLESEQNDTLFSMAEQQQLHSFLDEVNEETTSKKKKKKQEIE
jgi:hypothetical protein